MHRLPLTLVIKILLASTLLFSDGVFSLGGVEHQRLPRLVKAVKPAVVTVDVFDSSKSFLETGSGFFVTPDLIVSSRHVLWKSRGVGEKPREPRRAAHFAQAKTNDRLAPNEYNLRAVLLDDRESDIIVLQVENANPAQAVVVLAPEIPEEGEDIFVVSSPQGLEGVVTTGIVSALHNEIDMQVSASIGKGSSGAPVFNYRSEVVAIVNGFLTSGQNMNFAINVNRLRFLLSHLISADDPADGGRKLLASGSLTIPQWIALQHKEEQAHLNSTSPTASGFSIRKIFTGIHELTRRMIWGSSQHGPGDHSSEWDPLKLGSNRSMTSKPSAALMDPTPTCPAASDSSADPSSCKRDDGPAPGQKNESSKVPEPANPVREAYNTASGQSKAQDKKGKG